MLLKACFVISSLLFVACGSLPKKPDVTMCVIDYPRNQGICGSVKGEDIQSTSQLSYGELVRAVYQSSNVFLVPLSEMDKSVCFAPREWEKVQNYIDLLEDHAKNRCNN